MTSRRGSTLSHSKREREGESESEYRQEREREQELYYFVTSVVHRDCNQGAPRYLYKNVVVCMKESRECIETSRVCIKVHSLEVS